MCACECALLCLPLLYFSLSVCLSLPNRDSFCYEIRFVNIDEHTHGVSLCFSRVYSVFPPISIWQRLMDTKKSRLRTPSSSSSRSLISENDKHSVSPPPRRGPSTPLQSAATAAAHRHDSGEEHDPTDRELLTLGDDNKAMLDETSSNVVSDTEENQQKKRTHRHHRHRSNHKQVKSKKRSASHQRHSAKRR